MGKVFRPEDILKGKKKIIEKALQDLNPSIRDSALNILTSWEGGESKEKLVKVIGKRKVEEILRSLEFEL